MFNVDLATRDFTTKVLLVEDDEDDYVLTRKMFGEIAAPRYDLEWADNYTSALRVIEDNAHDVYLLDYRLGEKTGLDVAHRIIALGRTAPIILLTGQTDIDIDQSMEAGASEYLVKGEITSSLLERTIRYAIKQKNAEATAQHLACHDSLTGLPNRKLLWDRLERTISRHKRRSLFGGMLFLDLDNFKTINDSLGHSVGDSLLKKFAQRLTEQLRQTDTAARLGGDEFVLILEDLADNSHEAEIKAQRIAEKIQEALNLPIHIDNHTLHVSFSIGIAIFPGCAGDAETILKYADTAMYEAKAAGRNVTRVFKSDMGKEVQERLSLENDLRNAAEDREFELYFQPQIDIASGRIIGAESLIRWKHPEKGIVPPDKFIPVAEKSDIIISIGDWVLRAACNQLKVWKNFPILAVNVSTKQLLRPDFTTQIQGLLEELEIDPQRLELELTETILLADEEATSESMRALKDLGLRISLDDFGTGYSSLSYLKRLPFDSVKIDKSFVFDVTLSQDDAAIVEAIITLGKILKLSVVAEGVENKDQLEFLRDRECAIAPGSWVSPAVPADDFTALMARDSLL